MAYAAPVPPSVGFPGIGCFEDVPDSRAPVADVAKVAAGYAANVFVAWGDPIMPGGAPFIGTATETAAFQLKQFGMHNNGMHFFPLEDEGNGQRGDQGEDDNKSENRHGQHVRSQRGLLCVNNEYTHEEVLFRDGQVGAGYGIAKTRKSHAAHGVPIVEARRKGDKWSVPAVKCPGRQRRDTGNAARGYVPWPCVVAGPRRPVRAGTQTAETLRHCSKRIMATRQLPGPCVTRRP